VSADKLIVGIDYAVRLDGSKHWYAAGLDKLQGAGIWKREFARGRWGSPDAEVKTQPPSVDAAIAMFADRRAKAAAAKAEQARADERMRRRSLIGSSAAPQQQPPKSAAGYAPAELAALINRH
jgi:hypothetical protein